MSRRLKFAGGVALALIALSLFSGSALAADPALPGVFDTPALGGDFTRRLVQIFVIVTTLSLAPGLAMMFTCLPLIVTVLSILRQGAGLQQSPPNMLIMGLALFLTYYVMEPVFTEIWASAAAPLIDGAINEQEALKNAAAPLAAFMEGRASPLAIETLSDARGLNGGAGAGTPFSILAPAFALSEIQRAFEIGFIVLLPFLVIDLLVASILMAMGMMMVPPAIVSLPFKLAFFVLTNGWITISGALVRSYS
ncbi:MAG: flagellar type III secretion system pore protein FliP [Parvularculaceae bacterium]|nr:flagellar type III secretion system pore protein FliP [Parvularculaceae bacterium]